MTNEIALALQSLYTTLDPDKRLYLSYRYSGFSMEEACMLAVIKRADVLNWLEDDKEFKEAHVKLQGGGKEMRRQIHEDIRDRNMRLLFDIDASVLARIRGLEVDEDGNVVEPTKADHDYLKRIRSLYGMGEGERGNSGPTFNLFQLIQERNQRNADER